MKQLSISIIALFVFGSAFAQDDLLNELDKSAGPAEKQIEIAAFKGLQITCHR